MCLNQKLCSGWCICTFSDHVGREGREEKGRKERGEERDGGKSSKTLLWCVRSWPLLIF